MMDTEETMRFRVLSDRQIERIHLATLEVLARTGVRVLHDEGLKLLREAGCFVKDGDLVKIPPHLVEDAISSAPPRVVIANREGERVMPLEGDRTYFGTGSDCVHTLETLTGKRRLTVRKDVANAAKVCDALPHLSFVMSLGLVSDRHEKVSDIHQFQAMLESTVKPILFTAHSRDNLKIIRDIGWEVAGGREAFEANPFIIHYSEVISPLIHTHEGVDKVLFCAESLIPLVYVSGLMAGGTAPVTTAGALVLANAEALSGLVIHQLKRRGAPMISGGMSTIMDMRTSKYCHGAPELHLSHAALADLYHHYRIPIWGSAGCSDSELPDEQAAMESTLSCLMSAQSGANLVHDVGYLDNGLTGCLEVVVMVDEIAGMVDRVMRGVEITEDSLAVDVIDRVGPGGEFLSDEHTYRLVRREHWYPTLLNRSTYDDWSRLGGKDLRTRLNERAKEILETHEPRPLDSKTEASVRKIVEDYEKKVVS